MWIVVCLQFYIRLHLLSGLWSHVIALFQGYVSMGLSPLAPDWTLLEGRHHLLCLYPFPAQPIAFKPSQTVLLFWRHCLGWGLAQLSIHLEELHPCYSLTTPGIRTLWQMLWHTKKNKESLSTYDAQEWQPRRAVAFMESFWP